MSKPEAVNSPYVVDQTTPGFARFYRELTELIPYRDSTRLWVISTGGSGKTTHAQALALMINSSEKLQKQILQQKQTGLFPRWGDRLKTGYGSFDMCLDIVATRIGEDWHTSERADLILPAAAYLMGYTINHAKFSIPKPNILILDLPVIPHARETGRSMMQMMISGQEEGEIDWILALRPDRALREHVLTQRREADTKTLEPSSSPDQTGSQLERSRRASAEITEKVYKDQLELIDYLLDKRELSKSLRGFRDDPVKEDRAIAALHRWEAEIALGEHWERFFRSLRNPFQKIPIPSYRHLFEGEDNSFSLHFEERAQEAFGPTGLGNFETAVRSSPPWLKVFLNTGLRKEEDSTGIMREFVENTARRILIELVRHGKRKQKGIYELNLRLVEDRKSSMYITEFEIQGMKKLIDRGIIQLKGPRRHPHRLLVTSLDELLIEAGSREPYLK